MPLHQDRETERDRAGEPVQGSAARTTVQLGADYLKYARQRFDAQEFKSQLVARLLPTVPRRGNPLVVRAGEKFGKFQVEERLGKGGMAEVFGVIDPERGRNKEYIAIKVMKDQIAHDPEYVRRFLREAANTALIDHANVVQVYEVGSVSGRLYFTMELLEGVTLKEHLRAGPVSEEEGVQILCQLVDGLVAAHERGIGHRDLKPSNIMLVTNQARYGFDIQGEFDVCVKVTDFGLAHQITLDQSDIMPGGRFLGTAKYVAPEVVKGETKTLKSDVFSLGILAFSMFAGRAPFKAKNKIEYITANIRDEAPLLHEVVPVSRDLSHLVDTMLKKEPRERPEANGLSRDLRRLSGRSGRERIHVSNDQASVFQVERSVALRERIPEGVLPIVAGLATLLIVVLVTVRLLTGDAPAPTPAPTPTPPEKTSERPPDPPPTPPQREVNGVPIPAANTWRDALAPEEFPKLVKAGDAAWSRRDVRAAIRAWERAGGLTTARIPALRQRLDLARRDLALEDGDEAEKIGDLDEALEIYKAALRPRPADAQLLARLERVKGLLRTREDVRLGLIRARDLSLDPQTRRQAAKLLRELLPKAKSVGQEHAVQELLDRLPKDATAPVDETPPELRDALRRAQAALTRRRWSEAQEELDALDPKDARVATLRERLVLARAAPDGTEYLEISVGLYKARGFYVRRERVTNREYLRWYRQASQRAKVVAPSSWGGNSKPPPNREKDPVRGVRLAEARRFAAARGERLATTAERKVIGELSGIDLEPLDTKRERFPQGFRTVRSAGGSQ